jgi:hypothetical protein
MISQRWQLLHLVAGMASHLGRYDGDVSCDGGYVGEVPYL